MIKGLMALVTSGILLNPMVIAGIVCGIYLMHAYTESEIIELFKDKNIYLELFALAFLFAFFFERVYLAGGKKINWSTTFGIAFGRFVTLLITIVFTCLFIFSFSFGETDHKETTESKTDITEINEIIFR